MNLLLSFLFYFIAVLCLFSTKTTDFLTSDLYQVATIGINLGYAFSVLGNVFLFYFTENIFFEKPIPYLREVITIGNGVTLGFLLIFIIQVQAFPFLEIPGVYIPPHLLIWHVVVSSVGFLILLVSAYKEVYKTTGLPRVGFFMIGTTAIFQLFVFILFFADRFAGGGYTIWYFLAWISASIAGIFAMIGFLMPAWFRKIILTLSGIFQSEETQ